MNFEKVQFIEGRSGRLGTVTDTYPTTFGIHYLRRYQRIVNKEVFVCMELSYPSVSVVKRVKKIITSLANYKQYHFFVDGFTEPRTIDHSIFIELLVRDLQVPPANITYFCTPDHSLIYNQYDIKIVRNPYYGSKFYSNVKEFVLHPAYKHKLPHVKNKLFFTLNRRANIDRYALCAGLHNNFDKDEYHMSLGTANFEMMSNEKEFYNRYSYICGGDINFGDNIPIVFDYPTINPDKGEQWMFENTKLMDCVFGIVCETNGINPIMDSVNKIIHKFNYISEKSLLPIINATIPIIFNTTEEQLDILKYQWGFDLFPDIVDYKYLNKYDSLQYRVKALVNFLKSEEILALKDGIIHYNERLSENRKKFMANYELAGEMFSASNSKKMIS